MDGTSLNVGFPGSSFMSNSGDGFKLTANSQGPLDFTGAHFESNSTYDIELGGNTDISISSAGFNSSNSAAIRINSGKFIKGSITANEAVASPTYWIDDQSTLARGYTDIANDHYGISSRVGSVIGLAGADFGGLPNALQTLTDGATVTWNVSGQNTVAAYLLFTVHGGTRNLNFAGAPSAYPPLAASYTLYIQQDATGGEGLVLNAPYNWKSCNGGSGSITLSTGANAIDVLTVTTDNSATYACLTKNFN